MANGDGNGIPIPDVIDPPESMSMTLCIPKNRDHMAAFFGALYQLTEWNSWQKDGTTNGKDLAAVWWRYYLSWDRNMSDLECEDGMGNCCTEPAITRRVNPVTGLYEQSTNGGATWSPAPGGINSWIVQPVPPVTNGVAATKCDAATNVSEQVNQWITQVSNDFDTATTLLEFSEALVLAIVGAVLTILTAGALTAVEALIISALGAALIAVWGAGKAVFVAYWTTDVKDKILCAAYENIGDDGSFTQAQFTLFWTVLNSQLPPAPAKMLFMGFLSSVGAEGLNAMAASGMSADADCSDCVEEFIRIYTICNGTLGGTETNWDDNWLSVTADNVGSGYAIRIVSDPAAPPCVEENPTMRFTITNYETVSGTPIFATVMTNPANYDEVSPGLTPPEEWCAHRFTWTSPSPFSMRFKAINCV